MSQAIEFASSIDEQLSRWLGAIPVLMPIFQRLNVVSIINRYCPCQADVDEGTVALVLALNRLMSPRPLYKVAEWMAETVLEETLGISAQKLHDRRLGDLLELIEMDKETNDALRAKIPYIRLRRAMEQKVTLGASYTWGNRTVAAIRRHKLLNPDVTRLLSYDMSDPLLFLNFRKYAEAEIF